jgi:hypothetical protein
MRLSIGSFVLLGVLAPAIPVSAQEHHANPDAAALRNDCRLARQVLLHGQPANKREWALGIAPNCGTDGADAIAHQLRQARTAQARTPALDAIANAAVMIIDEQIYVAARSIAVDASAGEAARVHALGIWLSQVTAGDILPYDALVSDPATGGELIFGPSVSEGPLSIRALPADALASSATELTTIVDNEANPRIRVAARQVLSIFEVALEEANR